MNEISTVILKESIRKVDCRFLTASGGIDLLEMSKQLPATEFHRYIELSREYRARSRKT